MIRRRILVVDEDTTALQSLTTFLAGLNYDVYNARSGLEAVHKLRESRPHLIIVDIFTPGIDGLTLTKKLKDHPKGNKIPLIVTTNRNDKDYLKLSYDAGADLFLSKPLNLTKLMFQIDDLMAKSKVV